MVRLEFVDDAAVFLDAAGEFLAADPVVNTVLASVAGRTVARAADGRPAPARDWWLVVRDERGAVVGAAMRTAPAEPRPLFLSPMPTEAAVALARQLHGRGEEVLALNGALPATRECADELARLTGLHVQVAMHLRQHRAAAVVHPRRPSGVLRPARAEEADLVHGWFLEFFRDADVQAGRAAGAHAGLVPSPEEVTWRVDAGEVFLWEDGGVPVHMTCLNTAGFGVQTVSQVYTPVEHRGRGYAGAAVAELTGRILAAGLVPCLYTDQANPVSNKLYAAIGYEPVVDSVNLALR